MAPGAARPLGRAGRSAKLAMMRTYALVCGMLLGSTACGSPGGDDTGAQTSGTGDPTTDGATTMPTVPTTSGTAATSGTGDDGTASVATSTTGPDTVTVSI